MANGRTPTFATSFSTDRPGPRTLPLPFQQLFAAGSVIQTRGEKERDAFNEFETGLAIMDVAPGDQENKQKFLSDFTNAATEVIDKFGGNFSDIRLGNELQRVKRDFLKDPKLQAFTQNRANFEIQKKRQAIAAATGIDPRILATTAIPEEFSSVDPETGQVRIVDPTQFAKAFDVSKRFESLINNAMPDAIASSGLDKLVPFITLEDGTIIPQFTSFEQKKLTFDKLIDIILSRQDEFMQSPEGQQLMREVAVNTGLQGQELINEVNQEYKQRAIGVANEKVFGQTRTGRKLGGAIRPRAGGDKDTDDDSEFSVAFGTSETRNSLIPNTSSNEEIKVLDIRKLLNNSNNRQENLSKKIKNSSNPVDRSRLKNIDDIEKSKTRNYQGILNAAHNGVIDKLDPVLQDIFRDLEILNTPNLSKKIAEVFKENPIPLSLSSTLSQSIIISNDRGRDLVGAAEDLGITVKELEKFAPIIKQPAETKFKNPQTLVGVREDRLNEVFKKSLERKLGKKLPDDLNLVRIARQYQSLLNESLNEFQQGEPIQGIVGVEYDPLDPKQKKDQDLIQGELIANLRQNPRQHLRNNTVLKFEGLEVDDLINLMEDKDDFNKLKIEVTGRSNTLTSALNEILPRVGPATRFNVSDEDGDLIGTYFIGLSRSAARERYKANSKLIIPDRLLTEINLEIPSIIHLADYIKNSESIIKVIPNMDVKAETGQVTYTVLLNNEPLKTQGQTMIFPTRADVAKQLTNIIQKRNKEAK